MSPASGLAVYFVIWWLVLFAVLPWGVRTQQEAGEVVPGSNPSSPVRPLIVRKLIATSLIAAIVFAGVYWARVSGLLDFSIPVPSNR